MKDQEKELLKKTFDNQPPTSFEKIMYERDGFIYDEEQKEWVKNPEYELKPAK